MGTKGDTMPFEGSSEIDTGGLPSQTINDDSVEESQEEVVDQPEETQEETQEEKKVEYTEKGTKLDPNPQSRAYQELANERRLRSQYQQVLENPEALKRYAKEMGLTLAEAKAEIKEEQSLYTPDRFKTADDVANALNEIHANHQKELEEIRRENESLKQGLTGFSQTQQIQRIATNLSQDVSTVREKYPELNPKSPDYDPDLEKEIGELYHELDFDERAQTYRGNYSLAKLTERVMKAAGKARQKGSQDAQTQVKVKQAGRVVTSSKGSPKPTGESSDPGTVIAQRIAKALGNN